MLSSLVTQLEGWTTPTQQACIDGGGLPQVAASPESDGDEDDAPERAALRLSASVAEQREAIARQLMADDAAVAAALERRVAQRARRGESGSRWRTVLMGLVMPAAAVLSFGRRAGTCQSSAEV